MVLIFAMIWLAQGASAAISCGISGCLECNDSNQCTNCDETLFLVLNEEGRCQCRTGYYADETEAGSESIICLPCIDVLANCSACDSSEVCNDCIAPFVVSDSSSECVCPSSTYFDESSQTCENCPPQGCLECSDSETCDVCDEVNNFQKSGDFCQCKPGFYLNVNFFFSETRRLNFATTYECISCDVDKCINCLGPGRCAVCEAPYIPSDDLSSCICPEEYIVLGESCEFPLTLYSEARFESVYSERSATYIFEFEREIDEALCSPFLDDPALEDLFFVGAGCAVTNQSLTLRLVYLLPLTAQIQSLYLLQYYQSPFSINYQSVLRDLGDQYSLPSSELVISGPEVVYLSCPTETLEFSASLFDYICAGDEDYSWDVSGDNVGEKLKDVVTSQSGLSLQVPVEYLTTGVYYFTVTVTSLLQASFFAIKKVEFIAEELQISLQPSGPEFIIKPSTFFQVQAIAEEICEQTNTKYEWFPEFKWDGTTDFSDYGDTYDMDQFDEYEDQIAYDRSFLEIFPGTLSPGGPYVFSVIASQGFAIGNASITIFVESLPPVAVIDLDSGVISNDEDLKIDGSDSFDQDTPGSLLQYAWSCAGALNSQCIAANGEILFQDEDEETLEISKERLRPGAVYNITLTVVSANGLKSSTFVILTIDGSIPSIEEVDFVVNPQKDFEIFVELSEEVTEFIWILIYSPVPVTRKLSEKTAGKSLSEILSANSRDLKAADPPDEEEDQEEEDEELFKVSLSFPAGSVPSGEVYGYNLQYTTVSGVSGSQDVYFYTNLGPVCDGIEIFDIGEKWYINIDNCEDAENLHYPLTYFLNRTREEKTRTLLNGSLKHFKVVSNLKVGTYLFEAEVCDTVGTCTEIQAVEYEVTEERRLQGIGADYGRTIPLNVVGALGLFAAGIIAILYCVVFKTRKVAYQLEFKI